MVKVEWATYTFPALNLWNMPLHEEIVKKINQYYYEHYKWLWEEDKEDGIPYQMTMLFNNETRVIKGILK